MTMPEINNDDSNKEEDSEKCEDCNLNKEEMRR